MKTLVWKTLLLACMILATMVAVLVWLGPLALDERQYMAAAVDKENRLCNTPGNRIVFVGGSNLAFGLDSKWIEESTSRPVVNMGLHAGLGLPFILNEAKGCIRKDDIVILSFEYNIAEGDRGLQSVVVDLNPKALRYIDMNRLDKIAYSVSNFQRCVRNLFYKITTKADNSQDKAVYRRDSFSFEGDMLTHLGMVRTKDIEGRYPIDTRYYSNAVSKIAHFVDLMEKRGAKVFIMYPNYPRSEFDKNRSQIKEYETMMQLNFKNRILGEPEMFAFPDEFFYDTLYHLTREGREKRTSLVLSLLKPHLDSIDFR